jgi:SNF2 family DNA or RNA helicase
MGLGKTAITITYLRHLLQMDEIQRVLVIAPKRVAQATWPEELQKWAPEIPFTVIAGTASQRLAKLGEQTPMHVISRDNLQWLSTVLRSKYDLIVIDELSSFKNPSSIRSKAARRLTAKTPTIGLTGTPAPNGYINLWSQIYLLDEGHRLGHSITSFRSKYFTANPYTPFPDYQLRPEAQAQIDHALSDIALSMSTQDYLPELPPQVHRVITVQLPQSAQQQYDQLRKDMVLTLASEANPVEALTAPNAAALASKLLQITSGSVYHTDPLTDETQVLRLHAQKLEALQQLVDDITLDNAKVAPVLVYYLFRHEADHIKEQFPQAQILDDDPTTIQKWNRKEIPLLLAHPQSAGHGLNLQRGGNTIVWFTPTYDLELYEQANKRLHRMGQPHNVFIYHLLTPSLIDHQIYAQVLPRKSSLQQSLLSHLSLKSSLML